MSANSELEGSGRTDWKLIFLIFFAGVAGAWQVGKVPPALDQLRSELSLTLVGAGWAVSMFTGVGVLSGVLTGAVADRLGQRKMIIAGLLVTAGSGLIGSFAGSQAILLASRFIEGLGYLTVNVSAPVLISRIALPSDRKLAIGLWSGFMPVGTASMMFISPLILEPFGWRWLWLINSGLLGCLAWLTARSTRSLNLVRENTDNSEWLTRLVRNMGLTATRPGPLLLAATFCLYALNFMALAGFLPILLNRELAYSTTVSAVLSAIVVLANFPGNLTGGWLLQRGVKRVWLLSGACLVMGLCGWGIYQDLLPGPVRYLLCVVFTGMGGMIPAACFEAAPILAPRPDLVATTTGFMLQGASLGSTLGPPTLAVVMGWWGGWSGASWLICGSAGLGIVLALSLGRVERAVDLTGEK